MRRLAVIALLLLAGCATQRPASKPVAEFLAFGDSGYAYEYLEPDDGAGILSPEAYLASERAEWIEDKRPISEFDAAPPYRRPDTGGYVNASGQAGVARAMQRYCQVPAKCEFAVMLGDNIYPDGATLGKDGHDDAERFRKLLLEPYAPLAAFSEQFRIYVVLGNHDWRTSREAAMAQVRYLEATRPFYMDGIRYRVAPTGDPREVEIFALDTHVLLSKYSIEDDALDDDGHEIPSGKIDDTQAWALPQTEDEWRMVEWLEETLAASPARWKIVIGHHPLWSSAGSKYRQAIMMRRLILPALCRHADLYLAGHEHTLEVYTDSCEGVPEAKGRAPLPEVVSGAAGKQRPLNSNFARFQLAEHPELRSLFAQGLTWGFAHVTLGRDEATIQVLAIPDDGSGTPALIFEHTFARRSGN
jgi:tartrate-resistant acid phosphatase type 5